jgi:hypothetical protein
MRVARMGRLFQTSCGCPQGSSTTQLDGFDRGLIENVRACPRRPDSLGNRRNGRSRIQTARQSVTAAPRDCRRRAHAPRSGISNWGTPTFLFLRDCCRLASDGKMDLRFAYVTDRTCRHDFFRRLSYAALSRTVGTCSETALCASAGTTVSPAPRRNKLYNNTAKRGGGWRNRHSSNVPHP